MVKTAFTKRREMPTRKTSRGMKKIANTLVLRVILYEVLKNLGKVRPSTHEAVGGFQGVGLEEDGKDYLLGQDDK